MPEKRGSEKGKANKKALPEFDDSDSAAVKPAVLVH